MNDHLGKGLSIRNGVVQSRDVGYILACDPKLEEGEVLHTKVFKWDTGRLKGGTLNFSAHTCCLISEPEFALVMVASQGEYGVSTDSSPYAGNIFKTSGPQPKEPRCGAFWSVSNIGGKAYAVGHHGMVYRLDDPTSWKRTDQGLPDSFGATAIDGFDASDIYAVGYRGEIWHFDGKKWRHHDLPTNVHLHSVKCAGDGNVYVCGRKGTVLCGRNNKWKIVAAETTKETLWDLEWFERNIYITAGSHLYKLLRGELTEVKFGKNQPKICYQLSAAGGVMWCIGARDIVSYDGNQWSRVV